MKKVLQLIFLLLLFASPLAAQESDDSVACGTVVVKRPPVPASYTVKVTYDYETTWQKKRFWESRVKTFRRGYQTWLSDPFPPSPVSVAHKPGDSIDVAADSMAAADFKARNDRPNTVFKYTEYVEAIRHSFAWTDSVKIDSARFEYRIDTKGRVTFVPVVWTQADTSCRKFETEALTVMRKLWLWYPAQHLSNRNSKLENVACRVIVTVYAFDGTADTPPPIIVNAGR